jgi:hypothetical protein
VSFYTAVPRQLLDASNVGATFKQMGRKTVPQAMHCNMLLDGGNLFKNKRGRLKTKFGTVFLFCTLCIFWGYRFAKT